LIATIHRPSNTDKKENLKKIVHAFSEIKYPIILPLHPRTKKMLKKFNLYQLAINSSNLKIIDPVGYLEMLYLEKNAKLIITDSGGMQKEAYMLRRPCVTIRKNTEWVETLGKGNMLVQIDVEKIKAGVEKMINEQFKFKEPLYGSGNTARKISKILVRNFL